jgi:LysM repeat protein
MEHSVDSLQTPPGRGLPCTPRARRWRRAAQALALAAALLAALIGGRVFAQEAVHIVARGEQLGFIARRYGVSLADLAAYNGISNPSLIYVGQKLLIPSGGADPTESAAGGAGATSATYTVQRGDTLSEIAQAHGVSTAQLMALNGLARSNLVRVGQVLRVPAGAEAPPPAAPEPSTHLPTAPEPAGAAPELTLSSSVYVVRPGETLSAIAKRLGTTADALKAANGLADASLVRVGQRLTIPTDGPGSAQDAGGKRWIEIDLTDQTLTAWQDDLPVLYTHISSGKSGTPTVTGSYRITSKFELQTMIGTDYILPDVPWVMYFHGSYAIHGAYWHNAFGVPTSHGCINLRVDEARALFAWAERGTEVVVH